MLNNIDIEEKKEMIAISYSKTFDKNMAYVKVGLTEEEITFLEKDKLFQDRLYLFLIQERELIISNLRVFMSSDNDRIAFQATMDVAHILYPDFFKRGENKIQDEVYEDDGRLIEEYGKLLGEKNCF